jgi:hypothetical protein
MVHHLAHLGGTPDKIVTRIAEGAAMWAPAFPTHKIAERAERPIKVKADTLAWRQRLKMERRTQLTITSIGAFDVAKEDRPTWLRAYHRQCREDERRAKGIKARRIPGNRDQCPETMGGAGHVQEDLVSAGQA